MASGRGPVEDPPTKPPLATAGIEDQIARAIAASRPGPEHQCLEPLVGSWNSDLTWYAPPNPPLHLTGTTENRWILGGRYLLSEGAAGEGAWRVEGMTVYGHDPGERRFSAVGLNNLNSRANEQSGTYDPVQRSFILTGKERNQATGGLVVYRHLVKIHGPDRYSLSVFLDNPGRSAQKLFEGNFKRR
jgi:hypothetical protein